MSEAKYESKITSAPCSAVQIYRVLSNMENLERVRVPSYAYTFF